MKVVLVGNAHDKRALVEELAKDYDHWHFDSGMPYVGSPDTPAVGAFADYRTELYLAAYRAHFQSHRDVDVLMNSLLDSLAHATVRLSTLTQNDALPDEMVERWWLTVTMVASLVRDSFSADLVFYIPDTETKIGSYDLKLAAFYPELLTNLDIEHTVLDGSVTDNAETVVTMVHDAAALAE